MTAGKGRGAWFKFRDKSIPVFLSAASNTSQLVAQHPEGSVSGVDREAKSGSPGGWSVLKRKKNRLVKVDLAVGGRLIPI
jgi:hypothetical protein